MLNLGRLYNELNDPERMEDIYRCAVNAFEKIIERGWQVNRIPYKEFHFSHAYCELCKKFPLGVRYVCRGCYNLPDGWDLCGDCFNNRRTEHPASHEFLRIPSESWEQSHSEKGT
jgi:hypothetical protein